MTKHTNPRDHLRVHLRASQAQDVHLKTEKKSGVFNLFFTANKPFSIGKIFVV